MVWCLDRKSARAAGPGGFEVGAGGERSGIAPPGDRGSLLGTEECLEQDGGDKLEVFVVFKTEQKRIVCWFGFLGSSGGFCCSIW